MADNDYGMGPCELVFDPDGENVVISETKGGVKLFYEEKFEEDSTDQSGQTRVIKVKAGADCYVEAPVVKEDAKTIHQLTPTSKFYEDTTSGAEAVVFDGKAGANMLSMAKPLVVKPIGQPRKYWVTLFMAIPTMKKDSTYQTQGGLRTTIVRFDAVPEVGKDYRQLMFGDPTALPVAERPFTAGLA